MMEFLIGYCVFSLATGITACYELLYPVLTHRKAKFHDVENEPLTYFSFLFAAVLMAPLVFTSCIVPSLGIRFRMALYDGLFKKD